MLCVYLMKWNNDLKPFRLPESCCDITDKAEISFWNVETANITITHVLEYFDSLWERETIQSNLFMLCVYLIKWNNDSKPFRLPESCCDITDKAEISFWIVEMENITITHVLEYFDSL